MASRYFIELLQIGDAEAVVVEEVPLAAVALRDHDVLEAQVDEIAALSIGDFWGPNSAKYCAAAIAGAAWLYYTEGNMLLLGMVYMLYRRTQTPAYPTLLQRAHCRAR